MYKVFVNDCPLVLMDTENISTKFGIKNFDSVDAVAIIEAIFQNKLKGIYLFCNDLDRSFEKFQSNFYREIAAGGKVINAKKETLFIYRYGKWDLPKGKLEKGESFAECAIREVEEECGITNLNIEKKLLTTHHIFKRKQKVFFKTTHWFLMCTNYSGDLKPQTAEGIEQVLFKNKTETTKALQNTYENIKLLF
jgi:ADP-ribose pyrophosphatase YjhB (NUDIX family)